MARTSIPPLRLETRDESPLVIASGSTEGETLMGVGRAPHNSINSILALGLE
jgi:hypothetical protein